MKSSKPVKQIRQHPFKINIENYKIVKALKDSDFSTIYIIEDINTNQMYVAKVMKDGQNDEKKMISREIGILMIFQHPTIIKFYGYSSVDFEKRHCATIIMDYAKKGSLQDILKKKRSEKNYDNTARQIILAGVAQGMMFLHQHHVIHRDLKPSNILLDDNLHPHITDFGLSKTYENGEELFQSIPHSGVCYMAPELLKVQRYNGKVDVYSFGIIMYEILTESPPYPMYKEGKDQHELRDKIVKDDFRPTFNSPIKHSFRQLIERCWSKDPNERPTFEEIFNKLAFNIENSVYDVYAEITEEEENEDQNQQIDECENKYYLEGVDVDKFLCYIDGINDGEQNTQENDPLLDSINELRKENEELRKQLKGYTEQISNLNKLTSSLQKKFNDEVTQQIQINESHNEKIKNYKKEIKILKKRLQSIEKDNNAASLLADVSKYKKVKMSGHHSQGKNNVIKAENEKGEFVAIKIIRDDDHTINKELFINDACTRASFNHIALLPLLKYSIPTKDDDYYSIISPYMVNGDLHQLILKCSKKKQPANWETIKAINIFGIAAGMAFLHSKNIIYKDLNSSAILLDENFFPKIGKIKLPSLPEKLLPEFKKPIYIAPELYNSPECTEQADVYSYAFILFELFTLQLPKSEDFTIKIGSRSPLTNKNIPQEYEELIERCWSQDEKARPTFKMIVQGFVQNTDKFFNNVDNDVLRKYITSAIDGLDIT